MNRFTIFFAVIFFSSVGVLSQPQAYALVDGQLLFGQRTNTFESDGESESISATETQLSVHLDPIPLVPVALGLYYITHGYEPDDEGDVLALDELSGQQMGVEIFAWVPFDLADLSVFGKAGYTFYGEYKGKLEDFSGLDAEDTTIAGDLEVAYHPRGYKLGAGMKWSPIAFVSALLEVDYGAETWSPDSLKWRGSKVDDSGLEDIDSTFFTILVGLEAGF